MPSPNKREYDRVYRLANRAKLMAYRVAHRNNKSAYDAARRDARRVYNAEYRRRQRASIRAYFAKHRAERRVKDVIYRAAHPDQQRAYQRAYRAAHPDRVNHHHARRLARKRGATGTHTLTEWREKCAMFCNLCVYCGEAKPLTRDHKVPLSRGGTDDIGNIVPACLSCNARKRTKTATEFLAV